MLLYILAQNNYDRDSVARFKKQYLVRNELDGSNEFRFGICSDAKGKMLNYGVR